MPPDVRRNTLTQFSRQIPSDRLLVVAGGAEGVEQLGQAGDVADGGRDRRAVEVGAEADAVGAERLRSDSRRGATMSSSGVSAFMRPSARRKLVAKLSPTMPADSRIASSCLSVRLRECGAERVDVGVGGDQRRVARARPRPRSPSR